MQNNPQIDQQLIAELRQLAKEGATVPELSAKIHQQISIPETMWIWDVLYFREAFYIGIKDAKSLGAWEKLTKHRPAMSDEEINEEIMPLILSKQAEWDK